MKTINLYIQPKIEQKCQAHNLKDAGSNPTATINIAMYMNTVNVI